MSSGVWKNQFDQGRSGREQVYVIRESAGSEFLVMPQAPVVYPISI